MSPAPMYPSFAGVTLLVLGLLILLARASQAMFDDRGDDDERAGDGDAGESADAGIPATGAARIERHADTGLTRAERIEREVLEEGEADDDNSTPWQRDSGGETPDENAESPWGENPAEDRAPKSEERVRRPDQIEFTTGALLVNVAFSQGVFGAALVGAAWLADLPPDALGIVPADPWNLGVPAVALGVAVGVALYVANELAAAVADAAGVEYTEGVRESLAPDSPTGWAVLLGVVLPVIAGFEELLFRAALIGAFSAGFGLSPWLLAVLSTLAFAAGHGAQGPGGVAVTGVLGFALAAAFVVSGSLLVVVVAHYVVNALEFVIHEEFGIEWV
ncbi:CPBP family intramembrane glutamic endopeptidase [Halorussus litoreus]|uniref:CPBP family intramembrane glutamic endopeptidase n=1 Tax=Halorussus litoreus TaxID=1710536 RepID=UPI001E382705|nr:type II CAAX endopeptidase family protein [Halorussus litoreus]